MEQAMVKAKEEPQRTAQEELAVQLDKLETLKTDFAQRERELGELIEEKKQAIEEAVMEKGGGLSLRRELRDLEDELTHVQESRAALDTPRRRQAALGSYARAVIEENREALAALRHIWETELIPRLEEKRREFLAVVALAGALHRKGQELISQHVGALDFIPSPKPGPPGFMSQISEAMKKGPIYVTPDEVEAVFKAGKAPQSKEEES